MNPTNDPTITAVNKTAALQVYADTCSIGNAAAAAGVRRRSILRWIDEDEEFAREWAIAERVGITALEDEAKRRAFQGVDEPLTYQGQFTYLLAPDGSIAYDGHGAPRVNTVKKFSDGLVALLLKAHAPEKYADRSKVEVQGNVTVAQALIAARRRVGK